MYNLLMVMEKPRVHGQAGFSLVEIMLAIVLSAVALSVGFTLLALGSQVSARTETLLAANSVAFAKVQEYENKQFANIPIGLSASSYIVEDFSSSLSTLSGGKVKSGTAKVYTQYMPNSQSLIKMNVVIEFQYGSRLRKIEYGTYIQMGGVGR